MTATGSAQWLGGIKDGRGSISSKSGALAAYPYGFSSRFEGRQGSNPEELIGAAHAACFTMALALILNEAGLRADKLDTVAEVSLGEDPDGEGFAILGVRLRLEATVPGVAEAALRAMAERAKAGCPVSKLLKAPLTLDVALLP